MDNQSKIDNFIDYFKSLTEKEQFALGVEFNNKTGGKLSPFNSPSPVAIALIQVQCGEKIKILAGRRGINPKIGELALIGGFVNSFEEVKEGVVREVFEETGLATDVADFTIFDIKTTPGNQMLIFFKNQVIFDEKILETLVLNDEVTEFLTVDENDKLCFPLHQQAIEQYFNIKEPKNKLNI